MLLLPKGNPLFENMSVTKLNLPETMTLLSTGNFSGYACFQFQSSTAILVFESGKMLSVILEDNTGNRLSGFEALTGLVELIVTSGSGSLNIYKLSKDLTICIHALMQGEILYKGQELRLIDSKLLIEKIKSDRMNGCLRVYTADRSAIIFFKDGQPLGFFHDGSDEIELSSSESQKIATLPGAKMDLFSSQDQESLQNMDLLDIINVKDIWDRSVSRHNLVIEKLTREREEREKQAINSKFSDLEEQLKTIVSEHVGKAGRAIVDKELSTLGGISLLKDEANMSRLLTAIEKSAKLLIGATTLKTLMGRLQSLTNEIKN